MSGVSQLRTSCGSEPPADRAICSSRTPSTSKPPLPRPHDRTLLTTDRSAIIRSNITLLGTVFVSAFGMQLAFDQGSERIWNNINKGRQWKDIKHKYVEAAEDDE
ncbi:hypothetical protein E8E11_010080 [Didymella keratinophila]|nr:hypothetical protein E8E11_010080 [Didymella keratinophila]